MAVDTSIYLTSIYKSLFNVSAILFLVGMSTSNLVSLSCYQSGYVSLGFAIMLILIQILNNLQSKNSFSLFLLNLIPFSIMLIVIFVLLYFTIIYRDIIISNKVSQGYNTFSNIVTIIILIQTYIIYSAISSKTFEEKGVSKVTLSIILLLSVLSGIATNIIRTILKYFTTDGFQTQILKI